MITAIAGSGLFEPEEAAPDTSEEEERDGRIGEWVLDRWQIEEHLGSGGMSAVYGAVHRTSNKRVAVKVLHARLASIADAVDRFRAEAAVASKVEHPGAVTVFDEGSLDDGSPCIVMERLDGGSLDQLLDGRGPLPLLEAVVILDRLLDILVSAHHAGVIHRDVKPDNVFLTTHGEVKLLDFGIARNDEAASETQTGQIMGTPAYMPPEQAEGRWKEVDRRADVFSAGAVGLALLAGEPPRVGETPNLTLLAAMSVPIDGVRERRLDVPPAIAEVIDRAIAWSKRDRYPSVEAMRDALREAWRETFASTIEGHERRLASIGKSLENPMRTSGVQRTAGFGRGAVLGEGTSGADRTATMPALRHQTGERPREAPGASRTLRFDPAATPKGLAMFLGRDWADRLTAIPEIQLALTHLPSRRHLLVVAAGFTVLVAMLCGIALARLFAPEPIASAASPPAPTVAPAVLATGPATSPLTPAPTTITPVPIESAEIAPFPPLAPAPSASAKPPVRTYKIPPRR